MTDDAGALPAVRTVDLFRRSPNDPRIPTMRHPFCETQRLRQRPPTCFVRAKPAGLPTPRTTVADKLPTIARGSEAQAGVIERAVVDGHRDHRVAAPDRAAGRVR